MRSSLQKVFVDVVGWLVKGMKRKRKRSQVVFSYEYKGRPRLAICCFLVWEGVRREGEKKVE